MNAFLDELRENALLADGAMGSYLFARTGRLSEGNHFYEALNINQPEVVRDAHLTYLQAGARCLTTNTFAANPTQTSILKFVPVAAAMAGAAGRTNVPSRRSR